MASFHVVHSTVRILLLPVVLVHDGAHIDSSEKEYEIPLLTYYVVSKGFAKLLAPSS